MAAGLKILNVVNDEKLISCVAKFSSAACSETETYKKNFLDSRQDFYYERTFGLGTFVLKL